MAVRPLVTTGIALASAGLLIATAPTVVAPLTQKDIKVVADTQVTLAATQLQQILDAYLTGLVVDDDPTDPTELANNGLLGVLEVLTAGGDFADLPLTNSFITGGVLAVASDLTTGLPLTNTFINGGLIGVASALTQDLPLTNAYINNGILGVGATLFPASDFPIINAYIAGGPTDGSPNGLLGVADLLTQDNPVVNTYINGGLIGVADLATTGVPVVNSYVNDGLVGVATELTANRPILNAYFGGYPASGVDLEAPNGIIAVTQLIIDRVLAEPATEETEEETFTATKVAGGETETTDPGTKSGLPKWEPKLPKFSPLVEKTPAAPELPGPIDLPEPTITKLVEKTDKGEQKPLVRDSLKFTPGGGDVILPFAGGGGADKEWNGKKFVKQLKDAFGGGKGESSSEGGDSE